MKKLVLVLCLVSAPAFADDKPPIWVMMLQFKSSSINTSYITEEKCRAAVKLAAPHLKKLGIVTADCFPVMQQ